MSRSFFTATPSPKVLLACSANWEAAARLPRVLKRAGCRVTALCPNGCSLLHTAFVDDRIVSSSELKQYLVEFEAHLAAHVYDWVILCDDPLLAALAARSTEDWVQRVLPTSPDRAQWLASKSAFVAAAVAAGLRVPPSADCRDVQDLEPAARQIGFPLMLKASFSFSGLGVRLARSMEELAPAHRELGGKQLVVAQRFVDGKLGHTIVLYDRGRPKSWVSAYKTRTWPGPFGPSAARQFVAPDDAADLVEAVGRLTEFSGFCAIDWICDERDGKLAVLEFNARPVPGIHMAPLGGVDFAEGLRELFQGDTTVRSPPMPPSDDIYPMFPQELQRAIEEGDELAVAELRRHAKTGSDIPWDDPPLVQFFAKRRSLRKFFE